MAGHQNRLSRFWQELKRRRVIHVITVYATAAFAIIEVIGNLTEPLNLPASLSTIVIIVLAVGFPPAIILSWLYDLTSGTFERTKPLDETEEEIKPVVVPNAWKIATYVSFVVIVGLIVLNIASKSSLIRPGMVQSLAILPFDNYTGDEQLDYVANGMHSSLVGDMGKVGALRVIGETSSSVYKNTDKSAPDIARELNVDALVEPTLTCYGDTVCILIKVITPFPEEKQIWVADYREDKRKIQSLWNQVIKQISDELKVELTPEQERLLSKSRLVDREAYDNYLKARSYWGDGSKESLQKALEYLNDAIMEEPDWAPLYSGLVQVWMAIQNLGFESPSVATPKIYENLNKALELDPDLSEAHYLNAVVAHLVEWDWEKSEKEFLEALAVNPSDAISRGLYAQLLCILQRSDEGIVQGDLALNIDPLNQAVKCWYAAILPCVDDCKTALTLAEQITADDPGHYLANNVIESAAICCKDYDKVIEAAKYILPPRGISMDLVEKIYEQEGFKSAYKEALRQFEELAQSSFFGPAEMAIRYAWVNEPDKAIEWFEKGYEMHDPIMTYINTKIFCIDYLFDDPRFIAILKKMNLPLPKSD
jgi:TolB-like protein